MFGFFDKMLELGGMIFLFFALLPFYFFALGCLKGSIKFQKSYKKSIAYLLMVLASFFAYIFFINLVVKPFF